MFDTETNVKVHQRDTAALAAEKGVRIDNRREVHYIRPSQVMRIESTSADGSVVHFFEGRALVLYDVTADDIAVALGWKS